jgi:hypothetical protein
MPDSNHQALIPVLKCAGSAVTLRRFASRVHIVSGQPLNSETLHEGIPISSAPRAQPIVLAGYHHHPRLTVLRFDAEMFLSAFVLRSIGALTIVQNVRSAISNKLFVLRLKDTFSVC